MNSKRIIENKWLLAEFSYSTDSRITSEFPDSLKCLCNIWKNFMTVKGAKYQIVYSERPISYQEFGMI